MDSFGAAFQRFAEPTSTKELFEYGQLFLPKMVCIVCEYLTSLLCLMFLSFLRRYESDR